MQKGIHYGMQKKDLGKKHIKMLLNLTKLSSFSILLTKN